MNRGLLCLRGCAGIEPPYSKSRVLVRKPRTPLTPLSIWYLILHLSDMHSLL